MFFTIVIIINQLVSVIMLFKDKSVSISENGQPHYKGQACSQIVRYGEVPLQLFGVA